MQKAFLTGMFLALSALSVAHAQYTDVAGQGASSTTSQGAPIVHAYSDTTSGGAQSNGAQSNGAQVFDSQPNAGVFVRSDAPNGVQTVSSSNAVTELRLVRGRAVVTLHHPADHSQILVDLPSGQVSLLKDGLYTFNANTETVRVLHGEAEAFEGAKDGSKGAKIKETQQLSFAQNVKLKAVNAYPYELTADLLAGGARGHGDDLGDGRYAGGFYGGYPYYAGAYGYPWGYGFGPYGYGYPVGLGFGFGGYGGFGGFGGFRGGFRR